MAADNLQQVLDGYEQERIPLGGTFLNQALVAATLNDNQECLGRLVKMGARNIDECILVAEEKGVVKCTSMLLLLKSALTGDKTLLCSVLSNSTAPEHGTALRISNIPLIAETINSGKLSTIDSLKIAQQKGHHSVWRQLLMLTKVERIDGTVDWSRLQLMSMDPWLIVTMSSWLVKINLSSNMLKSLPPEIERLSKVSVCKDILGIGVLF